MLDELLLSVDDDGFHRPCRERSVLEFRQVMVTPHIDQRGNDVVTMSFFEVGNEGGRVQSTRIREHT